MEGSKAALTSKETEIKLTNVARASLEEMLDDYRDYLRARGLHSGTRTRGKARCVRRLGRKTPQSYEDYRKFVETRPAEVVANMALCLIHLRNYLIDQPIPPPGTGHCKRPGGPRGNGRSASDRPGGGNYRGEWDRWGGRKVPGVNGPARL